MRAQGEVVDAEEHALRVGRVQLQQQLGRLQRRRVQPLPAQALRGGITLSETLKPTMNTKLSRRSIQPWWSALLKKPDKVDADRLLAASRRLASSGGRTALHARGVPMHGCGSARASHLDVPEQGHEKRPVGLLLIRQPAGAAHRVEPSQVKNPRLHGNPGPYVEREK